MEHRCDDRLGFRLEERIGDSLFLLDLGPHRAAFDRPTHRYALVIGLTGSEIPPPDALLSSLDQRLQSHNVQCVDIFVVVGAPPPPSAPHEFPRMRFLWNAQSFIRSFSMQHGFCLVVDPMLRIEAVTGLEFAERAFDLALEFSTSTQSLAPAPVLVLPNVFERPLCAELVNAFRREGGRETGYMSATKNRVHEQLDHKWKRRTDCMIDDKTLIGSIRSRIGQRVCPEIKKAFQFIATRTERDLVARYAATDGGHFAQHRDDVGPLVEHRRFALSILLNDNFDGGALSFPEYNFCPPRLEPGTAVVFSGSILHRVDPVQRGERFVFLTFLFDEAAEHIRLRNLENIRNAPARAMPVQGA